MAIHPAVQDPMNFPLVGIIQLDRWWRVYGSVGDLTRASRNACDDTFSTIGKGPRKRWLSFFEGRVVLMFRESSLMVSPTLNGGIGRRHDVEWTSYCLRAQDIWSRRYKWSSLRSVATW